MRNHFLEISVFSTPIGVVILAIGFIIAVYITRWIFGINKIIENQDKTNALLKQILNKNSELENNDSSLNYENKNTGDVNNPVELKNIVDNLK